MNTNNDFYEALMDGRWQPEVMVKAEDDKWVATYAQGETVVSRSSKWSEQEAIDNLRAELLRGTLEGEYFPNF